MVQGEEGVALAHRHGGLVHDTWLPPGSAGEVSFANTHHTPTTHTTCRQHTQHLNQTFTNHSWHRVRVCLRKGCLLVLTRAPWPQLSRRAGVAGRAQSWEAKASFPPSVLGSPSPRAINDTLSEMGVVGSQLPTPVGLQHMGSGEQDNIIKDVPGTVVSNLLIMLMY